MGIEAKVETLRLLQEAKQSCTGAAYFAEDRCRHWLQRFTETGNDLAFDQAEFFNRMSIECLSRSAEYRRTIEELEQTISGTDE